MASDYILSNVSKNIFLLDAVNISVSEQFLKN